MGNITQIIKDTLLELKKKNLDAAPKNYTQEFYSQVKKHNLPLDKYKISDCTIDEEKVNIFIDALDHILSPSIDEKIQDEITTFISKSLKKPSDLFEINSINKIKDITSIRISNDQEVVSSKTNDIIKLTKLLSKEFEKMILTSDHSSDTFLDIKEDLEGLNISKYSINDLSKVQIKLIETIDNLEKSVENHKYSLLKEKENLEDIEEKYLQLKEELEKAQNEKKRDYLTNIYNRRAFHIELEKIEKQYNIFNNNYAIALYDIDHFKKVNDQYGHECGDKVLKTFATLLDKLSRDVDILARYGGEEFIVILNYDDKEGIKKYIQRIKKLIKNREFKYKDHILEIKFSGGIAFRNNNISPLETINKADSLMYEAKEQGRDRVILEDGTII